MIHNAEYKLKMTALMLVFPVFAYFSARFHPDDMAGGGADDAGAVVLKRIIVEQKNNFDFYIRIIIYRTVKDAF